MKIISMQVFTFYGHKFTYVPKSHGKADDRKRFVCVPWQMLLTESVTFHFKYIVHIAHSMQPTQKLLSQKQITLLGNFETYSATFQRLLFKS